MRYYFLELLACPECKSRLQYYTIEEEVKQVNVEVERLRCRRWCGLHNKPVEDIPLDECKKCVIRDVKYGLLLCTNCGRWYPILDGIPILIDDKYRKEKEDVEFLRRFLDRIPIRVRELMKKPSLADYGIST